MNKTKKALGQFYTSNYKKIFSGLTIPSSVKKIIEPFVGSGHLLGFLGDQNFTGQVEVYDIDPQIENATKQDTLLNPPNYKDAYILTNPPFLARNKNSNKIIYDKYATNDLYKCFLKSLYYYGDEYLPIGGIIILPLNFFSSVRKCDADIRNLFFSHFSIQKLNIFEEQVFSDTSCTICSLQFEKCTNMIRQEIKTDIFSSSGKISKVFIIEKKYKWMIGGEIYYLPQNKAIKISRLIEGDIITDNTTKIKLISLDDGRKNGSRICLQIDENLYFGKSSSRTYATLVIDPIISIDEQKMLVNRFNAFVEEKRLIYHSLFLSNYRESKDYSRKRISFTLTFKILNFLITHF